MSLRQIVEQRSGAVIVSTIAAIAAGGAISGSYAAGVFDNPPPACYLTAPTSGATVAGSQALTATCGGSTQATQFLIDGSVVATDNTPPFTNTWDSKSVADGSHTTAVIACDTSGNCATTASISFTTANVPHNPVNTVAPGISGGLAVGNTDTCTTGTWTGDTTGGFTYQWKDGAGNISAATSANYVIGSGETGASIHCTVTATGGSGSGSADSVTVGPVVAAGSFTANVWLSPTGSDAGANCKRNGSPTSAPSAATACATPQKACNIASAGDTVGVMAGQYAVGFVITNCNPASTLTFESVPGSFVAFAPSSSIGPNVSNLTLQGDVIGHGVGFSLGQVGIVGNASPSGVTNLTWNDVNLYCQIASPWATIHSNLTNEDACSSEITINGNVANFTWNGGDQSDWGTCLTSCTFARSANGINPNDDQLLGSIPTNILIEHVTFKNYFSLDNNGSAGDHSEIWKIDQGNGLTFLDNSFTACSPPASTGYAINNSCNSGFIFFGQNGTNNNTADNITFTQNIISPGEHICTGCVGQKSINFSYDVPAAHETTITFLYNTIDGGLTTCGTSSSNKCGPGCPSGAGCSDFTGVNTTWVGNIGLYTSFGNCYPSGTYSHNVWWTNNSNTAAKCSASTDTAITNTTAATLWSSPNDFAYDYSPLSLLQAKGENTLCPATDINGKARPTLTPCDAGAVQH